MSYVEHAGGGHFLVTVEGKLMYEFLHQFLMIGDGSLG